MMNNGWLKGNIRSILAIIWSIGGLTIFIIVLLNPVKSEDKLTYMIVGAVHSIVMFSLGYYYSASKQQTDNIQQETKEK